MLRHNLLIIYRNFKRFKSTFFINLIGLSSGLACALLIYLWVNDELQMDKFHEKESQLFQMMEHQQNAEGIETTESTPGLLAEALVGEMPEVEYATPASWTNKYTLSVGEKNIKADGQYVGKDYFNIFSFTLIEGNRNQVLQDKNAIVISKKLAFDLFNTTEKIVGRAIVFQHQKEFIVTGILDNVPSGSSSQFDFLLSFEEYKANNPWVLEWGNNAHATYVVLKEGTDIGQFNTKIRDYVKEKGGEEHVTLFAKLYSNKYLYGRYENGVQVGGRIAYVKLFSIIAFFILIIACINFMNLSTAKAAGRMKEVGIKKAVGAGRKTLIIQYLGESMLMTFLSVLLAILIVDLFLPQFNEITGKHLSLQFTTNLILSFLAMTLFTGLIAGSYPALYLSGFSPSAVIRGKLNTGLGEVWARKGLVIFQFAVSVILIVSVLVVYQQIAYVQTASPGFNKDNIVYFESEGKVEENLETFISEIKKMPGIINASSIGHSMVEGGYSSSTSSLEWEGKDPDAIVELEVVRVNYEMMETLGIEMKEGRVFSSAFSSEDGRIVFNETAIDIMGLKDPIGKEVKVWGKNRQIIGVSKNFHFQSMHEAIKPLCFLVIPESTWLVMAKIEAGKEKETIEQLQKFHKSFNPGFSFDYKFLDEAYQAQYVAEKRVASLSKYFAGLAILISCLGLFGLAAFTAERRLKEIGIRKVLGSGTFAIVYLLSRDFTRIVLAAIVIALPLSYFTAKQWLATFAFKIELEPWYFIGAGFLALCIAWVTVGMQAIKAANVNPTKCLRNE